MGAPGLEPGTSSLSEKRSNQLSYAPETFQEPSPKAFGFGNFHIFTIGGAEGIRTHDILLAKQALYQLSYGPVSFGETCGSFGKQAAQYHAIVWLATLAGDWFP